MAQDPSVASAKRRRKASWRVLHRSLREVNTKCQALYRRSQKIGEQPSMISVSQAQTFATQLAALETAFAQMQRNMATVVQIIKEGI